MKEYRRWGKIRWAKYSWFQIKVFTETLLHCLGHKCSLFSTIKERHLNSQENFRGTPENREKHDSLAQQIFPHLRYLCVQELKPASHIELPIQPHAVLVSLLKICCAIAS